MIGWRAFRLLTVLLLALTARVAPVASTEPPVGEVAVSLRTAQRLGLRPGEVVDVGTDPLLPRPRRARVAEVWTTGEHPADVARGDALIRFHLPALESLLDRHDAVDRIVVRLRNPAEAGRIRDDLRALGSGYDVYTAAELVKHISRTFVVVSRFHRAIGLITVLASGIFLVTIMSLKLTEMRREIGALRLIGIGRGTIGLAVMTIALAVAALGSLIGVGLGAILVGGINAYYQRLFETTLHFATIVPATVLFAGGLAVALSLVAGAAVVVRLLGRRPLEQVGR